MTSPTADPPATDPPVDTTIVDRRIDAALDRRGMHGGSGGQGGSGLEPRVAKLEADVEYIKRDISELRADAKASREAIVAASTNLATLTERVRHLPSKGFIVTVTLSTLAVLGALILFQSRLQELFRIH